MIMYEFGNTLGSDETISVSKGKLLKVFVRHPIEDKVFYIRLLQQV